MKRCVRIVSFVLAIVLLFALLSCSKEKEDVQFKTRELNRLCQLSTIQCTVHLFFEQRKDDSSFIKRLFNRNDEYNFLVEFDVEFEIGVDFYKIEIEDNTVYVEISDPYIQSSNIIIDTLDDYPILVFNEEHVFIESKTLGVNDFSAMLSDAKTWAEDYISARKLNYSNAENNAKALILEYIQQVGKINEKEYEVEWVKHRKDQ